MQKATITLADMAELLANWRAQKKYANEKIPDMLRSQLLQILAKYPQNVVVKTLRLSHNTLLFLKRAKTTAGKTQNTASPQSPSDVHFIPLQLHAQSDNLPPDQAIKTNTSSLAICEIIHTNGARLRINSNDLNSIIQAFVCCK